MLRYYLQEDIIGIGSKYNLEGDSEFDPEEMEKALSTH